MKTSGSSPVPRCRQIGMHTVPPGANNGLIAFILLASMALDSRGLPVEQPTSWVDPGSLTAAVFHLVCG